MSQYVVSVESPSLTHRLIRDFCFLFYSLNSRADQMFRTSAAAKGEGLDPANMFKPPVIYYWPF